MDFLVTESELFSIGLNKCDIELMDAITTYTEAMYDVYLTESQKKERGDSLITKLNKFFANLINLFQNFQAQVKLEVERRVRASDLDYKLHQAYKDMKNKKNAGVKQVEVMDCWTLRDDYLSCVNELRKYADKFTKMKYQRVSEIDDDIEKFNKIIDKYNDKLQNDCDKKVTVPIDKMLNFVEDEINGRSRVLVSLDDGITIFKQMKHDCDVISTRKEILGPDVIPKHVGFIRRIANSICGFFKRWAVKIISSIVFIVG